MKKEEEKKENSAVKEQSNKPKDTERELE